VDLSAASTMFIQLPLLSLARKHSVPPRAVKVGAREAGRGRAIWFRRAARSVSASST
jgi:hypothetical protein